MPFRWLRRLFRREPLPSEAVFSEHVADDGSCRRYSAIVDIRTAENGHKLSFEMVMLLVLALEPDWKFLQ